jgi:hypothetical protein
MDSYELPVPGGALTELVDVLVDIARTSSYRPGSPEIDAVDNTSSISGSTESGQRPPQTDSNVNPSQQTNEPKTMTDR